MARFPQETVVTLLGSVTLDTNVMPHAEHRKIGGSVTYSGITFRKSGVKAAVITSVAETDKGLLELFRDFDIQVSVIPAEQTTTFVNINNGDERVQRMPHAGRPISVGHASQAFASARVAYLGPLYPADIADDVLDFLAAHSIPAVVDLQGYLRDVVGGVVQPGGHANLGRVLSVAYRAKVGHQELDVLQDYLGMKAPKIVERYGLEELVATAGRAGGCVYSASGEQTDYKAVLREVEVDTTGAGDVFFAAYTVYRDWHGYSVAQACREAAMIASRHVGGEFIAADRLAQEKYLSAASHPRRAG